MRQSLACAVTLLMSAACATGSSGYRPEWNRPAMPHRIIGNVYFVGTNELASFLVETADGHILIDTGYEQTVPLIRDSVRQLGFAYENIRVLLSSHAHADHAGGLARIRQETGARVHAMREDAAALESGGRDSGDTYPAVTVDRVLNDGDRIELGGVTLLARHTPGHTPGAATFITIVSDRGRAHQVVVATATTIDPGTRLVDDSGYPDIVADWQRTFAILESLTADVWVSQHTGVFDMQGKLARAGQQTRNPYEDPEGFRRHLATSRSRFAALLASQIAAQR